MRGGDSIVQTRLQRMPVSAIFVLTDKGSGRTINTEVGAERPDVYIDPKDNLNTLDLRFAIGKLVIVDGFDHSRVTAVQNAFTSAKARRVVCNYAKKINGSIVLEAVDDTEGVMNWESNSW